jgi:DNA-directed RNA polymerase-3 subunit RPC5
MRPQFHHIDAHTEQERAIRARDPNAPPARVIEPRAVHMTVKNPVDGEEDTTDTMAERITATQGENWRYHQYIDEDDVAAWESFGENLFIGGPVEENDELRLKVPRLASAFDDNEYLNSISAPRGARRLSRSKRVRKSRKGKEKEGVVVDEDSDSTLSDIPSESDTEDHPVQT